MRTADAWPPTRPVLVSLAALVLATPAGAQVALDGTANPAFRGALQGPDYAIHAEFGRRAGGNLFHSFERFGLRAGESATFSGPPGIDNVIGRVTGGERSDIDGALRSTVPGADLWFINPAGVVFGPNATLDVRGSFHVGTADELRFADGATFSAADPATGGTFTMAAPEAFGFLGAAPAGLLVDRSRLGVPAGEALSLVGGDITVTAGNNGVIGRGLSNGAGIIQAEAGRITLAALGGPGSAAVATGAITGEAFADIRLTDEAVVATSGAGGGTVRIRGGRFVVENGSFVFAANFAPTDARGGIEIEADAVTIGREAGATADAFGAGDAGRLTIRADEVLVTGGGLLGSSTGAEGDGGTVTVEAGRLRLAGAGSTIASDVAVVRDRVAATGDGGAVRVTAGELEVRAGGRIGSSTFAAGDAGAVTVDAGRLFVSADGVEEVFTGINSNAERDSTGAGGTVTVTADEVELRDNGAITSGTFGPGDAGTVTVTAGEVDVRDRGLISSRTLAAGAGGALTIQADLLTVRGGSAVDAIGFASGAPGTIELGVNRLHLRDGGFVAAAAVGQDMPAGDIPVGGIDIAADTEIVITGQRLDAPSGMLIPSSVSTQTFGSRPAGPITIRTPVLRMPEFGAIDSSTRGDASAGAIRIDVDRLEMGRRAVINSSNVAGAEEIGRPDATGGAGTIDISATESIDIVGSPTAGEIAAIGTITSAAGPGGAVRIATPGLRMVRGGISTESTGAGNAGNIVIVATDRLELDRGEISTTAEAAGGGRIALEVGELIDLRESEITTSVAGGATTTAGDIAIDPRFIVLDGGRILARANEGRGGNIRIEVGTLFRTPDSLISASAGPAGIDGTVDISAPDQDVTGGLAALPGAFVDASSLLPASCAAQAGAARGSFVGVGRGGLPPGPDAPQPGFYAGLTAAGPGAATPARVQPDRLAVAVAAPAVGCVRRG